MRKPRQRTSKTKSGLLLYLSILTLFFFLLQVSFLIRYSGFYLGDIKEVAGHLKIPFKVIAPVLFFVFVQLSIHVLFVLFIWVQSISIGRICKLSQDKIDKLGFSLWGLTIIAVVFANQFYFPNSRFASLTDILFNHAAAGFVLAAVSTILLLAFLISILGVIKLLPRLALLSFFGLLTFFFIHNHFSKPSSVITDASSSDKPNIIIIGIDSLRPDFLGYFGYEKHTPHLDNFFDHSTVFAESLTPIARTFPAWVSILTGEYPKQNGVRTDLQKLSSKTNLSATLSNILKQQGYATLYASDETRFSNIDERFGFERIVTPPTGFNDFFIGTLNDFPFSNLLVNTSLGKYLFPYSYGNRPVYATYDPDTFLKLLKPELEKPRNKPLFMAIHFCLPHTPYFWGTQLFHYHVINNYQAAVNRIDQQFSDFVQLLEETKLLEHAIVVVLSDHGETIELHGDRATSPDLFISNNKNSEIPKFYPESVAKEKVDETAGHGNDVLGLPQYHNVLAFRLFGMKSNQAKAIPGRVSLLDIKPTILALLKLPSKNNSGVSRLDNILNNRADAVSNDDFFVESDFSPQSVISAHPEVRDVLFEGINYFQVDADTTHLYVKDSMLKLIISSKQYADFYGEWVLALYPQNSSSMMPILLNLRSGQWTNDLRTPFALQSPAQHMLQALQTFYGDELKKVMNIA